MVCTQTIMNQAGISRSPGLPSGSTTALSLASPHPAAAISACLTGLAPSKLIILFHEAGLFLQAGYIWFHCIPGLWGPWQCVPSPHHFVILATTMYWWVVGVGGFLHLLSWLLYLIGASGHRRSSPPWSVHVSIQTLNDVLLFDIFVHTHNWFVDGMHFIVHTLFTTNFPNFGLLRITAYLFTFPDIYCIYSPFFRVFS